MTPKITTDKNICVVTGSSSGIGKGIVESLDLQRYLPVITYKKHAKAARTLERRIKSQGAECLCLPLDLSDGQSIHDFASALATQVGRIDTIICNAGKDYYHEQPDEATLQEWFDIFYPKVFGTYLLVKSCKALLQKSNNANIIGMSASLYEKPDPNDPAYSSACAAHTNYVLSLVYAYAPLRIRANVINPGPVATNLDYWKVTLEKTPDIFDKMAATSPTGSLATPADVARTIDYIVNTRTVNGNVMYVNAGAHLR